MVREVWRFPQGVFPTAKIFITSNSIASAQKEKNVPVG